MTAIEVPGYYDWHVRIECIESFVKINETKPYRIGVAVRTTSGDTRKYTWYPHNDEKRKGEEGLTAEELVDNLYEHLKEITNVES